MAAVEIKNFDKPDEMRPFQGKGHADVLMMGDKPVAKGVFEPGWRWSTNVKPIAGTDSCQVAHFLYVLEGRMRVHMDDGSEYDVGAGDLVTVAPGHDAEVLGDSPCVSLDFGDITSYAKPG